MKDFNELGETIERILEIYHGVCSEWTQYNKHPYNQSTNLVIHIADKIMLLDDIMTYRDFLNDEELNDKMNALFQEGYINEFRVKQKNSVYAKLNVYIEEHEKGTVPINKCFNDLMGVRVFTESRFDIDDLKVYIKNKYPNFRCISAIRGDYRAIHIYIKDSNKNYQWELQVWYSGDIQTNRLSHHEHKQSYTKWEEQYKKFKGGIQ